MGGCCRPSDFDDVFDEPSARRKARAYEREGIRGDSRRIVEQVRRRTSPGYTLLEVGGGVGEVQLELLKDGAATAVNVELASTYESVARDLAERHGAAGRIERLVGDFVAEAPSVAPADVVVMNRVVCCYPHVDALVGAAAEHARRLLVITIPVDRWWIRIGLDAGNLVCRLRGSTFRGYVHATNAVTAAATARGLRRTVRDRGFVWQLLAFER